MEHGQIQFAIKLFLDGHFFQKGLVIKINHMF